MNNEYICNEIMVGQDSIWTESGVMFYLMQLYEDKAGRVYNEIICMPRSEIVKFGR